MVRPTAAIVPISNTSAVDVGSTPTQVIFLLFLRRLLALWDWLIKGGREVNI